MGTTSKTTIVAECLKSAKHIRPDPSDEPSARENLFANAVSQRIFSVTLSLYSITLSPHNTPFPPSI